MSKLPQRKKTPEEIAQLRETMGLGGPAPQAGPAEAGAAQTPPPPTIGEAAPEPPAAHAAIPAALPPAPEAPPAEPRPPVEAKPVKSLRKSERGPAPAAKAHATPSAGATALPSQRRSEFEINQLRRSQAFSVQNSGNFIIAQTAHPVIVAVGYFSVFAAALLPFIDRLMTDVSLYAPATLCVVGLGIAGFILLKKKRSLHHAGFIAAIAILTLVFGALYYFPHLRNAP